MADSITSIRLFGYINKSSSQTIQNMIIVYSPPYDEIGIPVTESSYTHLLSFINMNELHIEAINVAEEIGTCH